MEVDASASDGADWYLAWFTIEDIALAYRHGSKDYLKLVVAMNESSRYVAPPQLEADLEVVELSFSPPTLHIGDALTQTAVVENLGPDTYAGKLHFQFYWSSDEIFEPVWPDKAKGGLGVAVELEVGDSKAMTLKPKVPLGTEPGEYYLIGHIKKLPAGLVDPDESNNIYVSDEPFLVLP